MGNGPGAASPATCVTRASARLARHGVYPGGRLSAAAAYFRELTASARIGHYGLILLFFPVIGLLMGSWAGAVTNHGLTPGHGRHMNKASGNLR
jgi:hypothetical protein